MIICRRRLIATTIPTQHTENVHTASSGHASSVPSSIVSAGIGATSPADEIAAPEDAAVWLRLFSSSVNGATPRAAVIARQNANPSRAAVTDMLLLQPIFRPLYRLHSDSRPPRTMPVATARTVSCRIVRSSGAGWSAFIGGPR